MEEDVEMSQTPPPQDDRALALQHLLEAMKLPAVLAYADKRVFHATQALRKAGDDREIKAQSNLILGECHEMQDKWHLAYYEYLAARDCLRAADGGPGRWTQAMGHALQFCHCKVFPR
ncbi:hypothetical protein ISF_00046 [Cordyceps fumosorosea ARSEF 2679]|uniref:Uncharacterized protein n=1 Tax=Cordyceps fumosorosea (strain ARSEF 2679) TaxID=1081104 RepID=A0A168DY27_CORFA|nr:hypothetical protein ISF_00046 [Cordyceps fumosorosea ARSEF 2679]OAA73145.1 hypothetical protein ISF_00046 [Cordyceps fumosorosea ARSEF 2679]